MIATPDITSSPVSATASSAYANVLGHLYATAALSFAQPTGTVVDREEATHVTLTPSATVADPAIIAELADAPELRAIEELRAWLHLSYEDVAHAAGLSGPSVLHHWRKRYRTGSPVRPRASTLEQLWRVHALVRAVAEALEGADRGYAVRLWVRRPEDGTTPLELLLAGRVEEVERRARRLLFDPTTRATQPWRAATIESNDDLGSVDAPPAPNYRDSDFG